ncbi:MAG: acetyl/propionyl/methylcrotonyl-CoA carboxylase subunit alpha [Hyphomicrobiaceae bacterium]
MFNKILIANRGEIACRVMTTARRMGIATVAVHSDADAGAKHVAMANEAVRIGPAPVTESYLKTDRIIEAALATGAQAIHPGYGFLSENPEFVEKVIAAGLVFIGPPASAIRAMGLKDAAKAAMEKAGVPVVPGYHGDSRDPAFLGKEAKRIGYPVLIKARAGGGGKGMRRVDDPKDFADALAGAEREALSSFGDPACLIEKYVTQPRHIEIQVFADTHGNVVHLYERDCSLQRRHQKVIEEAPAPGMTPEMRAAMGRAAVEAARAVGYTGAGTVEFIADGSGPLRPDGFWFMEMNTRLQVEHPVTEAITGLDLVELQLRVAAGERLPFTQDDLAIDGHAFEARIYAEDVPKGFLPAIGTLSHFSMPPAAEFERAPVRVDSGVREGDTITPFYDPMIAKLIVHGATRREALNRLVRALSACHIAGSVTNLAFLSALARHEGFAAGEVDTGLIARDLVTLASETTPDETIIALAALAALGLIDAPADGDPWIRLAGFRQWGEGEIHAHLEHGDARIDRAVTALGGGRFAIGGASPVALTLEGVVAGSGAVRIGDVRRGFSVVRGAGVVSVFMEGAAHHFTLPDQLAGEDEGDAGGDQVAAPMPGLVKVLRATAGQKVAKGDALVVLEAMKMEHTLAAPRDGMVREVLVAVGDQVAESALLLSLEPETADGAE